MVYPYHKELQPLSPRMNRGNFGLWYNKFIPIKDFDSCCTSDDRGKHENAVSFYQRRYNEFQKDMVNGLLKKKHRDQEGFCESFQQKYEKVVFRAKLGSPLITGIGESHPHEVSMVFEHNMGIPYIPASGIKGIVRFAHTLGLISNIPDEEFKKDKDGRPFFDDEEKWTRIPLLFGTQKKRGRIIFLDAYPEKVPELHVDIMNPHYGKYYGDDTNAVPPADYLDPNPIKFLTVSRDTVFIFRALVDKNDSGLLEDVRTAFRKALTEEGVGAKTAVGYGIFQDLNKPEQTTGKGGTPPRGPEGNPTDDREIKAEQFRNILSKIQNLPGQIDNFLNDIKAQQDKALQKELCAILLETAMRLSKKSKFSKALSNKKNWAIKLKALCDELGLKVQ